MNRRQSFEGLVLRALNILLYVVARYHGQKTTDMVAAWKTDVRAYMYEPWESSEEEIAAAEVIEHYDETLKQARAEGRIP